MENTQICEQIIKDFNAKKIPGIMSTYTWYFACYILLDYHFQCNPSNVQVQGFERMQNGTVFVHLHQSEKGLSDRFVLIHKVIAKNNHRCYFSNLSNWKEEAWKNQGFNGIWNCDLRASAIVMQCSTNWVMKPHIGSEVN